MKRMQASRISKVQSNMQVFGDDLKPQADSDPAKLFIRGVQTQKSVESVVKKIIANIQADPENIKEDKSYKANLEGDVCVKGLMRTLEKALLRPNDDGNTGNADFVRDVVRCMIKCTDMSTIARAVRAFGECKEIRIIRKKNRFDNPTSGGWRDVMLNFVIEGDDIDRALQCE